VSGEGTAVAGRHGFPVRIYWEDTDAGGVVYHASYIRFLERGRTEFLRAHGVDQGALLRETGAAFVVRRLAVEFLRPARLDDLVTVETAPARIGRASLILEQAIRHGPDLLVEAQVTCACVRGGRASRLPAVILAALAAARAADASHTGA
jgi:acyl-CoA thioester hydrolase